MALREQFAISDFRLDASSICAAAGFAALLACSSYIGWPLSLSSTVDRLAWQGGNLVEAARNLVSPLVLMVCAAVSWRCSSNGKRFPEKACLVVFVACLAGAFVSSVASATLPQASAVCSVALGVLAISGVRLGYLLWQNEMYEIGDEAATKVISSGTVLGALLFFLVAWVPSEGLRYFLPYLIFIPLSVFCLVACRRRRSSTSGGKVASTSPLPPCESSKQLGQRIRPALRELLVPVLCTAALGAVWGVFNGALVMSMEGEGFLNDLFSLGRIVSGLLVFLLAPAAADGRLATSFFKYAFPCVITVLAVLPAFGTEFSIAVSAVCYTGFSLVSMTTMLLCNRVARSFGLGSPLVYSLAFGTVYLFCSLGSGLSELLPSVGLPVLARILAPVLLAVYVAFIASTGKEHRDASATGASNVAAVPPVTDGVVPPEKAPEDRDNLSNQADIRGLTTREAEVLGLLLKGRSAPYIAEALCVSESTIRSHSKSIYRKLGVHNRQELLDRFDASETVGEE